MVGFSRGENPFIDADDEQLNWILSNTAIDNLDVKSKPFSQFRRHYRSQFASNDEYRRQLRILQSRPELIPHFLIQYKKHAQLEKEKKLRLLNGTLNVDEQLVDLKGPRPPSESCSVFSDSASMRSLQSYRSEFVMANYEDCADNERLRNFKPNVFNTNNADFAHVINQSDQYWNDRGDVERTEAVKVINNVARVNRVLITEQEYNACIKIAGAFRRYRFRTLLMRRIRNRDAINRSKPGLRQAPHRTVSVTNKVIQKPDGEQPEDDVTDMLEQQSDKSDRTTDRIGLSFVSSTRDDHQGASVCSPWPFASTHDNSNPQGTDEQRVEDGIIQQPSSPEAD